METTTSGGQWYFIDMCVDCEIRTDGTCDCRYKRIKEVEKKW